MPILEVISLELLIGLGSIFVTTSIGFGGVIWKLSKRDSEVSELQRAVVALGTKIEKQGEKLEDHEAECKTRETMRIAETKEREGAVDARLAEGSKQLALLKQGQDHVADDVREIKETLRAMIPPPGPAPRA